MSHIGYLFVGNPSHMDHRSELPTKQTIVNVPEDFEWKVRIPVVGPAKLVETAKMSQGRVCLEMHGLAVLALEQAGGIVDRYPGT